MTSLPALAHFGENWSEMGGHHMGFFGGFWMMPLFLIMTVLIIVWLVKFLSKPNEKKISGINLLNILNERLARGEISNQEYEELKKTVS